MSASPLDLEKLTAPVGVERFFRDHWEREPLHIARAAPDYYAGLLSSADVDSVIAFTHPKFADPSAFQPEVPRQQSFVQGWLPDRPLSESAGYAGIVELRDVYHRKRTIAIMTMQQRWRPVAVLCRNLEGVFHCPVHANMYLTPPDAQGFDAHFDTHEVLVLQLEGSKHWRLYPPARSLPLAGERGVVFRDRLGPAREVYLEAGDFLYVPRGHVHEAFTDEAASMHLTVGINVHRWVDVLREALASLAAEDERFRQSLPPGLLGGGEPPQEIEARFRALLSALADAASLDKALRGLGDRFLGSMQPLPDGHFGPPVDLEGLDLDTVLEKAPGMVCRIRTERAWVVLEFPGGEIGGPLKIAAALRLVASARRLTPRALPGELGPEAKLLLARRFVSERLLTIADQPTSKTMADIEDTTQPCGVGN